MGVDMRSDLPGMLGLRSCVERTWWNEPRRGASPGSMSKKLQLRLRRVRARGAPGACCELFSDALQVALLEVCSAQ